MWEFLGSNFKDFIAQFTLVYNVKTSLLSSLRWIPTQLLKLFSCSVLVFPCLCLCVGYFFSSAPVVLEKTRTFSFEDIVSVPTDQTVGTKVVSFLAIGMFPKLPIGKFQIVVIFMSCALDQMGSSWGFLFPALPPVSLFCLICMQVRFVLSFNLLHKLCFVIFL